MTTEADFIRAICERPADDGVRLAYADWLEEQGRSARAEFIRTGFALAATGLTCCPVLKSKPWDKPYGCGACAFCKLQRAAEAAHGNPDVWRAVVGHLPFGYGHTSLHPDNFKNNDTDPFPSLYTRRGFVEEVWMPAKLWEWAGKDLVARQPVRRLLLTDTRPVFESREAGFPGWRVASWRSWPWDGGDLFGWFWTEQEAVSAFAAAALAWAREQAGLPALEPAEAA